MRTAKNNSNLPKKYYPTGTETMSALSMETEAMVHALE